MYTHEVQRKSTNIASKINPPFKIILKNTSQKYTITFETIFDTIIILVECSFPLTEINTSTTATAN